MPIYDLDSLTTVDVSFSFPRLNAYWTAKDIAAEMYRHHQPGDTFTANNVWDWIGEFAVLEHPNATMGSAFRWLQMAGVARSTGKIMQSTHPTRKRGMVRVWEWC